MSLYILIFMENNISTLKNKYILEKKYIFSHISFYNYGKHKKEKKHV